MAQPTPFNKSTTYTGDVYDGADLDRDFDNVELTVDEICVNLDLIQRDDGKLRNQSVHPDTFNAASLGLIAGNWIPRGEWVTGTQYAVSDMVEFESQGSFVAVVAHTANASFALDRAAGKWIPIGGSSSLVFNGSSFEAGGFPICGVGEALDDDCVPPLSQVVELIQDVAQIVSFTDSYSVYIDGVPEVEATKTYKIVVKCPVGFTVTEIVGICRASSGGVEVLKDAVTIDTIALSAVEDTSGAISVDVAAGQDIILAFSGTPEDVSITIKFTRAAT